MSAKTLAQFLRRRLRFSVRRLLALVLVSGCVIWFVVQFFRSAERQRLAVAGIRQAQGSVRYDRQFESNEPFANGELRVPKWLVKHIGVDFFANVTQVFLADSTSDQDLSYVGQFTRLEVLGERSAPKLSGAGIIHLKGLTALRVLFLPNTKLTDADLVHLSHINSLRHLDLSRTHVADAGLMYLEGLDGLESLNLESTQVTDAGLAHLRKLSGLQRLMLRDTNVSDSGLFNIEALRRLQYLDLTKTQVTKDGVKRLKQELPHLTIRCD
jgi:hypothetical protein